MVSLTGIGNAVDAAVVAAVVAALASVCAAVFALVGAFITAVSGILVQRSRLRWERERWESDELLKDRLESVTGLQRMLVDACYEFRERSLELEVGFETFVDQDRDPTDAERAYIAKLGDGLKELSLECRKSLQYAAIHLSETTVTEISNLIDDLSRILVVVYSGRKEVFSDREGWDRSGFRASLSKYLGRVEERLASVTRIMRSELGTRRVAS